MRKIKCLALLIVSFFLLCSCNKEIDYSKQDVPSAMAVKCIDGVLHFSSADECLSLMDSLSKNSQFRLSFEKEHNFKSLASEIDEKIKIVSSIEN